jgi:hypothetical protein
MAACGMTSARAVPTMNDVSLETWMARAERMRDEVRTEHDHSSRPEVAFALQTYLTDVEPCIDHLREAALSLEDTMVTDTLAAVYESIVAFGDELLVASDEEPSMLPDLLDLARTEREELVEEVRRARHGQSNLRTSRALEGLAVALVTVHRLHRAA